MCYKKLRKLKVAQNTYYSTMIGDLIMKEILVSNLGYLIYLALGGISRNNLLS